MNKLYSNNIINKVDIGRAKTILVAPEGPAIITSVIVKSTSYSKLKRIKFIGPLQFDKNLKGHIHEIILPQIDQILNQLGLPIQSYEISAQNIGAFSSINKNFTIEGYSADVSIYLAFLSSSLKIPISQNIVYTGHISSVDGDVSQVQSLVEKCDAAISENDIVSFVYPSLKNDSSYVILKPKEYENVEANLRSYRGKIKLVEINDTLEIIKNSISDESIVLGSLQSSYYEKQFKNSNGSRIYLIVEYLTSHNKERFWKSLEYNLLNKNISKSHKLINSLVNYYLELHKYPSQFGNELSKLIVSLPYSVKKTQGLYPLLTKDRYKQIMRITSQDDIDDINTLYLTVYGKVKSEIVHNKIKTHKISDKSDADDRLEYIIEKIDPDYIDLNITKPISAARGKYILENHNSQNYEEFLNDVNSFYAHLVRNNDNLENISEERISIESLVLLKKTFPTKKQFDEMIIIAIHGLEDGLGYVFDAITNYLKNEAKKKHISAIINETINPLDYELIKRLIKAIVDREKDRLGMDTNKIKPEQFVENYKEIIQKYAMSKHSLSNIFKKY